MYEFRGRVKTIEPEQTFSSGFKKRTIVVTEIKETDSSHANDVAFTLKKDHTSWANKLRVGDVVKISFAIDGRDWDDPKKGVTRHFVDLTALKVAKEGEASDVPPPADPPPPSSSEPEPEVDDMPF